MNPHSAVKIMDQKEFDEAGFNGRRFQAIDEHLCSDLNGQAVILSLKTEKYYGLNGVGLFIWSQLKEPVTCEEIQAALMKEYSVDPAACRRGVLKFLDAMKKEELIKILDEQTT